ncbi:MAG: hypothetical protein LT070_08100 [Solirubrobacteraceae bacterium]|nr:hypothetical protein [Solirubrobacteraceae bacterium]
MADRIELPPIAVERLIRGASLEDLRQDTTPADRDRSIGQGLTALDALCGLCDRGGTDEVWDVLRSLERRQLLAFATLAISELALTDYSSRERLGD